MASRLIGSLRSVRTRRLVAVLVAVVVAACLVTALAIAATGTGPVPPGRALPVAVRDALAAPPVHGVTARIRFTDKLIDTSAVQGADPLLSGATGRLWASTGGRFRLELQGDNGDAQIVSDGHTVTLSDPALKVAYRFDLPARAPSTGQGTKDAVPTVAQIQAELGRLAGHLSLSGAIPGDIAGRAAYTVRATPARNGGLLSAAELAWDAAKGVPLRLAVYAQGNDTPVLELTATDISFGSVPASTFSVTPPPDVKITTVARHAPASASHGSRHEAKRAPITGLAAVRAGVPFALTAPAKLDGVRRSGVRLVEWTGAPAALVTYGRGLGGIAVLESAGGADSAGVPAPGGHDQAGLTLPSVDIGGAKAQVLPTALGTVVRFARGGLQYVVAGSLPQSAVEAAARGL